MMPLTLAEAENIIRKIRGKQEVRAHLGNLGFVVGGAVKRRIMDMGLTKGVDVRDDNDRRDLMFTWFMENMATIIISVVLIIVVAAVIANMVRDKRKGKSSCGCGCSGCAMNGTCHPINPEALQKK